MNIRIVSKVIVVLISTKILFRAINSAVKLEKTESPNERKKVSQTFWLTGYQWILNRPGLSVSLLNHILIISRPPAIDTFLPGLQRAKSRPTFHHLPYLYTGYQSRLTWESEKQYRSSFVSDNWSVRRINITTAGDSKETGRAELALIKV